MTRLRRWILKIVIIGAGAISIAAGGLWIRSHYIADGIACYGKHGTHLYHVALATGGGKLAFGYLMISSPDAPLPVANTLTWNFWHNPYDTPFEFPSDWHHFAGFGFKHAIVSGPVFQNGPMSVHLSSREIDAIVPLWIIVLTGALVCAIAFRNLRRPLPGHCRRCGYDLRATPERCPECGEVPKGKTPGDCGMIEPDHQHRSLP